MNDLVWELIQGACTTVILAFILSGLWLWSLKLTGREPHDAVRWVFRIAKRLFWIAVAGQFVAQVVLHGPLDGWDALRLVLNWWNWKQLKDGDDDDFWKRAKEKATEVVKQVGERLVIVPPEPATAGA